MPEHRLPGIDVQLQRPFAVQERPCGRLVVWLLAATATRALSEHGSVSAQELAAQVGSASAAPMAVSRAFGFLAQCGLAIGWGADTTQDPATLALRGRARGPFWMPVQTARRLRGRVRMVVGGSCWWDVPQNLPGRALWRAVSRQTESLPSFSASK